MGDRSTTVFTDGDYYSAGVYVHWAGSETEEWLKEAGPTLRKDDPTYAAARYCGFCHERLPGPLGLGLFEPPTAEQVKDFSLYSPGDNGVFVVNVKTGEVTQYRRDETKTFSIALAEA